MIRDARFTDVPAVVGLLQEMNAISKYAGRMTVDPKVADQLLMGATAQQRQNGPQGSFFQVAIEGGQIVGFMVGVLDRVYHIGNKLMAQDMFLYVRKGASATFARRLIEAYTKWALANPRVIEVKLSWHDALPNAERIEYLYKRHGYQRVGGIFEIRGDRSTAQELAA